MADMPSTGWLPGFQVVPHAKTAYPGTFNGAPKRFVFHTTQGLSSDPAYAASTHLNPPQLWVTLPSHPYKPAQKIQVYSLDVAGRALLHPDGTPETNKAGAIQVEIEGFAAQASEWSVPDLEWLATEVLAPACAYAGVDLGDVWTGGRMSWDEWAGFNGLCGHIHVPGNDHVDPGGLDLVYLSEIARGSQAPPVPPKRRRTDNMRTLNNPIGGKVIVDLDNDGIVVHRWTDHGSLSAWTPVGPQDSQPFHAESLDAWNEPDGRLCLLISGPPYGELWIKVKDNTGWGAWSRYADLVAFTKG